jgi:hypothetical protein
VSANGKQHYLGVFSSEEEAGVQVRRAQASFLSGAPYLELPSVSLNLRTQDQLVLMNQQNHLPAPMAMSGSFAFAAPLAAPAKPIISPMPFNDFQTLASSLAPIQDDGIPVSEPAPGSCEPTPDEGDGAVPVDEDPPGLP